MKSAKLDLSANGRSLPVFATATPPTLFAQAVADHQAGNLDAAERVYKKILKSDPTHPDALHMLGAIELQRGRAKKAVTLIRKALKIKPSMQPGYYNLSRAYSTLEDFPAASRAAKRAWELAPDDTNAILHRGSMLIALKQNEEAHAFYATAIEKDPKNEAVRRAHALLLMHMERWDEAIEEFTAIAGFSKEPYLAWRDCAVVKLTANDKEGALPYLVKSYNLNPEDLQTTSALIGVLLDTDKPDQVAPLIKKVREAEPDNIDYIFKEGLMLSAQKKHAEAMECFERVHKELPEHAGALLKLAYSHQNLENFEEAIKYYEELKVLVPGEPRSYANLAAVYLSLENYEKAFEEAKRAIEIDPQMEPAHLNMGLLFQQLGDFDNAIHCYRRALEANPEYHTAASNLAFLLLASGQIEEGWDLYGHGFNAGLRNPMRHPRADLWRGEDISNETILVWKEQGVGDDIRFSSCFKDIIARAGHVIIETDARLVPLYQRSFPQATVRAQRWPGEEKLIGPPDFAKHTPAGQLPVYFRRSLDDFPEEESYLVPDPERVAYWRKRVEECGGGIRIGLSWRSMRGGAARERVYSKLEQWAELLATPGVTFINLQYDDPSAEVAEFEEKTGLKLHVFKDLNLKDELDEAAALTKACDLVISAGTSVADMAGATGTPVIFYGESRHPMQLGSGRFPWHPASRYIGRERGEPMSTIVTMITEEVRAFAEAYAKGEVGNDS